MHGKTLSPSSYCYPGQYNSLNYVREACFLPQLQCCLLEPALPALQVLFSCPSPPSPSPGTRSVWTAMEQACVLASSPGFVLFEFSFAPPHKVLAPSCLEPISEAAACSLSLASLRNGPSSFPFEWCWRAKQKELGTAMEGISAEWQRVLEAWGRRSN